MKYKMENFSEQMVKALEETGFFVVKVESDAIPSARYVQGKLETFLELARRLEAKVILVEPLVLDDDDFTHTVILEGEDDEEDEEKEIDLERVDGRIKKYRKYIGHECSVLLSLPGFDLVFEERTDWYKEFVGVQEAAIEKLENDQDLLDKLIEDNEDDEDDEDDED